MNLRCPSDSLASCVWLPRFIDKARHYLAGTLEADFARLFCHPLATDGAFLSHFELEKEAIIKVVADSLGRDESIAQWFRLQAAAERISAWNQLAPSIGKEGYLLREGFQWVLKQYYGGIAPDPRVDSIFTVIAFDEGYLEELAP